MRSNIVNFCATTGKNPLLAQGAGGNISWKDGNTLWIKASGTWLADAAKKDIFVPVDLAHLQHAISLRNFNVTPFLLEASAFRPSIETLLHALMPHPVVLHLHAIEVLAHLVIHDFEREIAPLLRDAHFKWSSIGYFKPGDALANAVSIALNESPTTDVVFLQNHGVVIGGTNMFEVEKILNKLVSSLAIIPQKGLEIQPSELSIVVAGGLEYFPVPDPEVHCLATEETLYERLVKDWALYPDHVVFLGARAHCYKSIEEFNKTDHISRNDWPELIFIQSIGVFMKHEFNKSKQVQLRCYFDVLIRQHQNAITKSLTNAEIADLLNWDAELYRVNLQNCA